MVARHQNDDAFALLGADDFDHRIEGRGPGQSFGIGFGSQVVMSVATDDHFGGFDQCAGGWRQPGHAVFTDADDVQPGVHNLARAARSRRRRPWPNHLGGLLG